MATTPAKGSNNTPAAENTQDKNATGTLQPVKKDETGQKDKPELSNAHVVKEEKNDLPPLEDRILKVQQLGDLVERYETLVAYKKKIDSFKFASDGQRDSLTIEDSKGNEFTTTNSAVIQACVQLVKSTLDQKIAEVDEQIRLN